MSTRRTEIEAELREILAQDQHNGEDARELAVMLEHRRHITQQLDRDAFAAPKRSRDRRATPWYRSRGVWIATTASAVACVLVMVLGRIDTNHDLPAAVDTAVVVSQQQSRPHVDGGTEAEAEEIQLLLAETLASADDIWELGEEQIDKVLAEPSSKRQRN